MNDSYVTLLKWEAPIVLVAAMLLGACLACWAMLYFQVQVKRSTRSQIRIVRAKAGLKLAEQRVDRALELAEREMEQVQAQAHVDLSKRD